MRTTLDIDEDVLLAAKSVAAHERITLGDALSKLARTGLAAGRRPSRKSKSGVPLLPRPAGDGSVVSLALVNRLRDEE